MEEEAPDPSASLQRALRARARMLGSPDPEEAAQEACLRALRNPEVGPALAAYLEGRELMWTPARLISWLLTTTGYVVHEQQRRANRLSSSTLPDAAPDQGSLPESAIRIRQRAALEDCLANLKDQPRRALLLQASGRKYEEIAGELGANSDTVASWIHRGRQQLEACMAKRLARYE
jgi:RNA polymerase sigma factor (sigma-70 family)